MIPEAVVKRQARRQGVDPAVIDRDHALGVILWALSSEFNGATDWVFKGGTCLRKAYFGDYRFSEDLDFTVTDRLTVASASGLVASIAPRAASRGVVLLLDQQRVEVMDDEYGHESIEIRVPYHGALRMGSAQNVQLHLSADEEILLGAVSRSIIHAYQDAEELQCEIPCYTLEEILAEKLRAIGGQRRHAIARDVFDIGQLASRKVNVERALDVLPKKAERKAVELAGASKRFRAREAEYRASWERTIEYLVSGDTSFDDAFAASANLLERGSF